MSEKSIGVGSYFECPTCKGDRLEEVMVGVQVSTTLSDLHFVKKDTHPGAVRDSYEVEYDLFSAENPVMEDGVIDHYQCENCGWVVRDIIDEETCYIIDPETLFHWLKEHKEKRENELNNA